MDKKSLRFGHPERKVRRALLRCHPKTIPIVFSGFLTHMPMVAQDWSTLQSESERFKDNYQSLALSAIDIIAFTAGLVALLTLLNVIKWKQGGENIGAEFGGWALKILLFCGGYGLIRILFGLGN